MANQNSKRPTADRRKALDLVEEWLHVESLAQARRRHGLHPNSAYGKSQSLYKTEIPKRWNEARANTDYLLGADKLDEEKSLRLGRAILQSASLAQHGFILGKIARQSTIFDAMDDSWHVLQDFKQHVRAGRAPLPPAENLELPIEDAVKTYTRQPYGQFVHTYIGVVAYSAVVALELKDSDGFVLPEPGVPRDRLERWDYDPQ